MWFKVFEQLNFPALVAYLPTLLIHSIYLFFAGGVLYSLQFNKIVVAIFTAVGGPFSITYLSWFISPSVVNLPLFHYPAFTSYQPSDTVEKVIMFIVGAFIHLCYLTLRCVTGTVLLPLFQAVCGTGALHSRYMKTQTISPGEHEHMRVGGNIALHNPPDDIDTSQKAQEEAILWLSQVPLDPCESKALVSRLAPISSRPYGRFQKPIVALANLVLGVSFCEEDGQEQTNTAIDRVLVLGNIKF